MSSVLKRKQRVVSSCIPCYNRKQRCNRLYPCNHCTQRRRVEECTYVSHPQPSSPVQERVQVGVGAQEPQSGDQHLETRRWQNSDSSNQDAEGQTSVTDAFGYSEHSSSNILSILRQHGADEMDTRRNTTLCAKTVEAARQELSRMPARPILDHLIQHFIRDVNWIHQLVHSASFLAGYNRWWTVNPVNQLADIEFAVLILRIGAYSSQFLPSPAYTADEIRGRSLSDIRHHCTEGAEALEKICVQIDGTSSLVRVQHTSFAALCQQCAGDMRSFLPTLGRAISMVQLLSNHTEPYNTSEDSNFFMAELKRRVSCSLYVVDKLEVAVEMQGRKVPGPYMGQLLQAKLAQFWGRGRPKMNGSEEYDPAVLEQKYETFVTGFLGTLPASFALKPSTELDGLVPNLVRQRLLLHIAVYNYICNIFKPLLQLETAYKRSLPRYKRAIVRTQKQRLTRTALGMLETVKALYMLLGSTHTRLHSITFYTFEATVLLSCVCSASDDDLGAEVEEGGLDGFNCSDFSFCHPVDPLSAEEVDISQARCSEAISEAHKRLEILSDCNAMAEVGARAIRKHLGRVLERAISEDAMLPTPASSSSSSSQLHFPSRVETQSLAASASSTSAETVLDDVFQVPFVSADWETNSDAWTSIVGSYGV
ncbi:hypothetical protein S40293_03969 [Stachybotrys chartarum IBT 40293]|nr:hypothetical protein S40293_03969 [Stachybotrys chartarum IBT 40293]